MNSEYWTRVDLYHTQEDFFRTAFDLVDRAKSSLYIEFYIFSFDPLAQRFLASLRAARARGVYVQLLVDGVGSQGSLLAIEKFCLEAQITFRVYRPLPWTARFFKKLPRPMWFRIGSWLRKVNRRNHRKMILVDETKALIGSFNLVQNDWRDSAALVEGRGVKTFLAAHKLAWFKSRRIGFFRRKPLRSLRQQLKLVSPFVRINSTQRLRSKFYRDFLRRIQWAQHSIYLVTPYFLPKRSFIRNLKAAARRGIDVKVILPAKSDILILKWATKVIIRVLQKSGVRFFEYQPRILHAKYYLLDHWSCLGSHNLNHRSFLHDLECEVVLTQAKDFANLQQQFLKDLENSKELPPQTTRDPIYLLSRFFFALRFWL